MSEQTTTIEFAPEPVGGQDELVREIRRLRSRVAELESATEWGTKWLYGGYCPAEPPRDEEQARQHARLFGTRVIRRWVGPWVFADTGEVVWP